MNKLIQHIRRADKRKFFIYLFSFLIFLVVNNLYSNLVFLLCGHHFYFNFWFGHGTPCPTPRLLYEILFIGFKALLFSLLWILSKRYPSKLLIEFFVAYFIYDLVYILAVIWDLALPIMGSQYMLESSAHAFLHYYFPHLWLLVSVGWTILLFVLLRRSDRLSLTYLVNRLIIIPFSVVMISFFMALAFKHTQQFQKHYYYLRVGEYRSYVGRVFNVTKQELVTGYSKPPLFIKFPKRIDSVEIFDRNGDMHKDTSMTSYFIVDEINDTISGISIDSFINSEIKLAYKTEIEIPFQKWKQKITGFKMRVLFPDGTYYNNYIKGNKISLDTEAVKQIHKNINNSYIVISGVFFLNDKGEEMKITDDVAWKLKYSR